MTPNAKSSWKMWATIVAVLIAAGTLLRVLTMDVSGLGADKALLRSDVDTNERRTTDLERRVGIIEARQVETNLILQRLDLNLQHFMERKGVRPRRGRDESEATGTAGGGNR